MAGRRAYYVIPGTLTPPLWLVAGLLGAIMGLAMLHWIVNPMRDGLLGWLERRGWVKRKGLD